MIVHSIYRALSGCDQTLRYISIQSENLALSKIRLSVSIMLKAPKTLIELQIMIHEEETQKK